MRYMMDPVPAIRWLVSLFVYKKKITHVRQSPTCHNFPFCKTTNQEPHKSAMGWHRWLAREHARQVGGTQRTMCECHCATAAYATVACDRESRRPAKPNPPAPQGHSLDRGQGPLISRHARTPA